MFVPCQTMFNLAVIIESPAHWVAEGTTPHLLTPYHGAVATGCRKLTAIRVRIVFLASHPNRGSLDPKRTSHDATVAEKTA